MTMRTFVFAALLLAPAPVLAQSGWYGYDGGPRHTRYGGYAYGGYGYQAGNNGGPLCQQLCPHDFSPCDPIYFKTADGRCNPGRGGGRR